MAIRYRSAQRENAAGIARVGVASWQTTYPGLVPDEVIRARTDCEERRDKISQHWERADPRICCYVAEDTDEAEGLQIVGYAFGGPNSEPDGIHSGELKAIYLLASHQKRGIGQRLVALVAQHLVAQGLQAMLAWCVTANPSRSFYEQIGGQFVRASFWQTNGYSIPEVAYGWADLEVLALRAPTLMD